MYLNNEALFSECFFESINTMTINALKWNVTTNSIMQKLFIFYLFKTNIQPNNNFLKLQYLHTTLTRN